MKWPRQNNWYMAPLLLFYKNRAFSGGSEGLIGTVSNRHPLLSS